MGQLRLGNESCTYLKASEFQAGATYMHKAAMCNSDMEGTRSQGKAELSPSWWPGSQAAEHLTSLIPPASMQPHERALESAFKMGKPVQ
jgi:hypothetical protein